jgi:hypothetical protein
MHPGSSHNLDFNTELGPDLLFSSKLKLRRLWLVGHWSEVANHKV